MRERRQQLRDERVAGEPERDQRAGDVEVILALAAAPRGEAIPRQRGVEERELLGLAERRQVELVRRGLWLSHRTRRR